MEMQLYEHTEEENTSATASEPSSKRRQRGPPNKTMQNGELFITIFALSKVGIGYTLAEWQPCYLVLSGLYLYVYDSEVSQIYQRCCSMSGRQVIEVPPASVGGSLFAIAVSARGTDIQKALESTSTLIIELHDNDEKSAWLKELVQATYRASAPPTINILGEEINNPREPLAPTHSNYRTAEVAVSGSLIETKLYIYGKLDENCGNDNQALIIEILATGGKEIYISTHQLKVCTRTAKAFEKQLSTNKTERRYRENYI